MFLFSRKYRQVLGLDITTSSIKLIELAMVGGRYRVEAFAAEPAPPNAINETTLVDPDAVGEAIRRAVKRAGATCREVAIAIGGDAAITKVIQMPKGLTDYDLEQQVELQADQYIPFPMDEVAYDFEVLGPSDKDPDANDVLLVASRSDNVEQRCAAVSAAGLNTRIVDVEAFALENACRLMTHQMPEGGKDHVVAVAPRRDVADFPRHPIGACIGQGIGQQVAIVAHGVGGQRHGPFVRKRVGIQQHARGAREGFRGVENALIL